MEIYFDENISQYVADAMNSMCKGHFPDVKVFATVKVRALRKKATDEQIVRYVAKRGGILITQDPDFRHDKVTTDLCRNHKVGVFLLQLSRGEYNHWEIIKLLINNWKEIIRIATVQNKPYWYKVGRRRIVKMF